MSDLFLPSLETLYSLLSRAELILYLAQLGLTILRKILLLHWLR
jgi:hypothetical protein